MPEHAQKFSVIPAVNCVDFSCVRRQVDIATGFFEKGEDAWVHIDVADGAFTYNRLWNNPDELEQLANENPGMQFEVHLMVERPEEAVHSWIQGGAKRLIVHLEALGDIHLPHSENDRKEKLAAILDQCRAANAEAVLASNPETPPASLLPYLEETQWFLVLGVHPGMSGQRFQLASLEKIKFIRAHRRDAVIEVDGGMNDKTARFAREAGANIIIAANYIFSSENEEKAFQSLKEIGSLVRE